ncbi:MAG: GatB/YqeY domain-containing protein [Candidatus Portnoybacteria bacterium]|nr:GatB/YqeY domain-containing protein [Candidatus Portnoybacteria bacterium]
MSLSQTIKTDLITALKEKDQVRISTLRMVQAAVKNREIELKKREEGLDDEETIDVLVKEAKKRKDSIEAYEKGKRDDLVKREKSELTVIETYLPKQLSEEEIKKEVEIAIKEARVESVKDMGKVMAILMPKLKGKADGGKVSKVVRGVLSGN